MSVSDNNKNRGAHGDSSSMLGWLRPSSENPPALAVGSVKNVPHLFAKATIVYCIAFASGASLWALYKQGQGASMADVLAIILGFFGGELLMLCLKTILKKESKDETFDGEQSI